VEVGAIIRKESATLPELVVREIFPDKADRELPLPRTSLPSEPASRSDVEEVSRSNECLASPLHVLDLPEGDGISTAFSVSSLKINAERRGFCERHAEAGVLGADSEPWRIFILFDTISGGLQDSADGIVLFKGEFDSLLLAECCCEVSHVKQDGTRMCRVDDSLPATDGDSEFSECGEDSKSLEMNSLDEVASSR
jgi:hypothetical protein